MYKGGRKRHSYWEEAGFEPKKIILNNETVRKEILVAHCTICKNNLQNTAEKRLRQHRNACKMKLQAAHIKSEYHTSINDVNLNQQEGHSIDCSEKASSNIIIENYPLENEMPEFSEEIVLETSQKHPTANINNQKTKKKNIKSFIDSLNEKEIEEINSHLLCFFLTSNIPFEAIESSHFINFYKCLRPAYKPCTIDTLFNEILDKTYAKIMEKMYFLDSLCILCISYQKTSKSCISMLLNNGNYLYIDIGESVQNFIEPSVQIAKKKYKATIYAIVSNADEHLCVEDENRQYWYFECKSKIVNEIMSLVITESLIIKIKQVLKYFMQDSVEKELLNLGAKKMLAFGDDYFKNIFYTLIPLLDNLKCMRQFAIENSVDIDGEVLIIIIQPDLAEDLKNIIEFSKNILEIHHQKKTSDFSTADAVEGLIKLLLESVKLVNNIAITGVIQNNLNCIDYTAYFLHPVYRGKNLSLINTDCIKKVRLFLMKHLDEESITGLFKFEEKTDVFEVLFKNKYQSPLIFWKAVEPFYPSLAKFSQKLLKIPAYTNMQIVHLQLQSNLTHLQTKKLTELFYMLKLN